MGTEIIKEHAGQHKKMFGRMMILEKTTAITNAPHRKTLKSIGRTQRRWVGEKGETVTNSKQ